MSTLLGLWLERIALESGPLDPTPVMDPRLLERIQRELEEHAPGAACHLALERIARVGPPPQPTSAEGRHIVACTPCALVLLERLGAASGLDPEQAELLEWVAEPLLDLLAAEHPEIAAARRLALLRPVQCTAAERVLLAAQHPGEADQEDGAEVELQLVEVAVSELGGEGDGRYLQEVEVPRIERRGMARRSLFEPSPAPAAASPLHAIVPGWHLLALGLEPAPAGPGLRSLLRACAIARLPVLQLADRGGVGSGDREEATLSALIETSSRVRAEVGRVWGWDECFEAPRILLLDPTGASGATVWRVLLDAAQEPDAATIARDLGRLRRVATDEAPALEAPLWVGAPRPFWMPEDTAAFCARFGSQAGGRLGPDSAPWRVHAPWLAAAPPHPPTRN
ncbi:MAG: hypothetical protein ABIO70_01700 [Pseudomonadota bacterium]